MSNWNPPELMPDESVPEIFYHLGDGGTLMSNRRQARETWPQFFKIMGGLGIKGWLPVELPLAPQPPTQKDLDLAAMGDAYRGQGIDFCQTSDADIPYGFKTGWYLALQYARK